MYTHPFAYVRVRSAEEAERVFRESEDPRFLAGGMTLIPTMKQRLAAPATVIDVGGVDELSFIRREAGRVVIGAVTRHAVVAASDEVRRAIPALAALAGSIGDPAVRNRGTIGGSLANNDPAADYPSAALALGASLTTSRRTIAADAFFTGMFATALEDGELLTEIAFPIPARAGYAKFRNPASLYAMVGVFVADLGGHGARVAVTGAGPCVFRARELEEALSADFAPESIARIEIDPANLNSDMHGSAEYRAHLVRVMAQRAVEAACGGRP